MKELVLAVLYLALVGLNYLWLLLMAFLILKNRVPQSKLVQICGHVVLILIAIWFTQLGFSDKDEPTEFDGQCQVFRWGEECY